MRITKLLRLAGPANLAVQLIALWKLFKHPHTPKAPKWVALAVLAYAVSPIDLIPDFIPVLGLLDDLLLVPLGVALVIKLTPRPHWESMLAAARVTKDRLPKMWWGTAAIVLIWALVLAALVGLLWSLFGAAS